MTPLSRIDVDDLGENDWRRLVVDALHDILISVKGVEGDTHNRGLVGSVADMRTQLNYEESQRKTQVLPRIQKLEHDRDVTAASEKAWRNGLTFALGTVTGVLGVVAALQVI
jgi:hypothetical protein